MHGVPEQMGRYIIRSLLGEGAFGMVYRAWDPEFQFEVAIKVCKPMGTKKSAEEAIIRFRREARAAALLSHSNILPVRDMGEVMIRDQLQLFSVMPLIDGPSLQAIFDEGAPFRDEEIVHIVRGMASGLQYAHDAGLVHRDIKPANIMIDKNQRPIIADFGMVHVSEAPPGLSATGQTLGTPGYMSPEQINYKPGQIDGRADIYSAGVVMYEMLCGARPYNGSVYNVIFDVAQGNPFPAPSEVRTAVNRQLERICLRAMAHNKDDRYPTADDLLDDLLNTGIARRRSSRLATVNTSASPLAERPLSDGPETELDSNPIGGEARDGGEIAEPKSGVSTASHLGSSDAQPAGDPPSTSVGNASPGSGSPRRRSSPPPPPPPPVPKRRQTNSDRKSLPTEIANSLEMAFKLVPAGRFTMGSPESEPERDGDEHQHPVRITQPFYLQSTPVTQRQWATVMDTKPWQSQRYVKAGAEYPATYISWEDAVTFCQILSETDGQSYRLPTEAEWEYACRAGSRTRHFFGDDTDQLDEYAWFDGNTWHAEKKYAQKVGRKKENPWGLFDMHGNIWEWCSDWYDENYYLKAPETDPRGPLEGSTRVFRGGCWSYSSRSCRSADRDRGVPTYRFNLLGFRLAMNPPIAL